MSEPNATYLISAYYSGTNNSMPVSGFKTLSLAGPGFKTHDDLVEVANVITTTLFEETHYKDLEVTVVNVMKLPL